MKYILPFVFFSFVANVMFAQTKDSTKTKTTTTTTITTIITENIGEDSLKIKQDKKIRKKNIIKTNLAGFFISTIHLNYERVISKKVTLQLGYYAALLGANVIDNGSINGYSKGFNGFGITPEIRFYPNGVAPVGFFVALSPRFQSYKSTYTDLNSLEESQVSWNATGIGFLMGRQFGGRKFSVDMYLGPSINYVNRSQTGQQKYNYDNLYIVNRIGFRCGLTFGFAF